MRVGHQSPVRGAGVCMGPGSRRQFLKLGSLGIAGLSANGVFPTEFAFGSAQPPTDTSVIFLWLPGGPPHMEMYDMKPDAPAEFRGDFKPIPTVVPGLEVCDLLPLHAKFADRFNIIRSVAHEFADHGGGHKRFMTGRDPKEPTGFVNDFPAIPSYVAKLRQDRQIGVPNYVMGCEPGREGIDVFSFGSAFLDSSTHPFTAPGDPSEPTFSVRNLKLNEEIEQQFPQRLALLSQLDQQPSGVATSTVSGLNAMKQRATTFLTSEKARVAFDLRKEHPRLRERYGMHAWGQRCLLARRLVEAGVSFVTMVLENPTPGKPLSSDQTYNWDSHAVNCHIFNDAKIRFPLYDQAVTALVEDLYQRGLDRKVMLIVTGEFGRTPRITYSNGRPGRDHWPQAMSMLVAGAGMRTGQVIGSTNSRGEHPKDRPLSPNDLWATMFRHLGIDPLNTMFDDFSGRPTQILPFGLPIRELI